MRLRFYKQGMTLMEMMITLLIITILAIVTYSGYQSYVKKLHITQVHQAMLENTHFLEQYYARKFSFKKNSTTWVDLPQKETNFFCIKLQGNPRGTNSNNTYSMKAVAFDKKSEPRVLRLNQDGVMQICENSSSTCDENLFFKNPGRADTNCSTYP